MFETVLRRVSASDVVEWLLGEIMTIELEKDSPVAFIPIGGMGKRLRPIAVGYSKALVRIVNRPLVGIVVAILAKEVGVRRFVFGVKGLENYQTLWDYFKGGTGYSAEYDLPRVYIEYQPNFDDVGSADSLRINMEYYSHYFDMNTPILVVQGDNLFDATDIRNMLSFHKNREAFMTIALTHVDNVEGYGVAEIDKESDLIKGFVEKPITEEAPSNLINTGIYIFDPKIKDVFTEEEIQEKIRKDKRLDFGYDLIPYLVDKEYGVYGYQLKHRWHDVGTPQRYLRAMQWLLQRGIPFLTDFYEKISKTEEIFVGGMSGKTSRIHEVVSKKYEKEKIAFKPPVVFGKYCAVGDGVYIKESTIDNYTKVGNYVTIKNSAIMDFCRIDDHTEIRHSIIDRGCIIRSSKDAPTIISHSAIGRGARIEAGCSITASNIEPRKEVKSGKYVDEDAYKET